ncbi:MAG: winged helix-turn-helix domain-containing protein [Candidatus Aenigmatarchaeota archaeon]
MKKENRLIKLLFRPKPLRMILSLNDGPKYISVISKETDCTYSHTIKVLEELKEHGLIEFTKSGRIKVVTVTKKGEEILKLIKNLNEKINNIVK